ncbi:hypothetical protein ASPCAL04059 [Aspergillus calidoustus]|uniref:Uncharacterized protein n=1 Tax=Aspergillus calidoustus TaxID=454130 RepID=A0A0U5FTP8_ASPCI|nr:hypothetical protein ASPCAL04059 [Aspergillus calidoustus]
MTLKLLLFLVTLASLISAQDNQKRSWLVLETDNIQTASQSDGLPSNNSIGYTPSAIDPANFINHCTQRTLTNGKSFKGGSCNGIVMGDIPAETNMISTIITYPFQNQLFTVNTPFFVRLRTANLAAGSVTNPNSTLYAAPQAIHDGKVIGHVHVTIQQLFGFTEGMVEGQEAHIAPPDPTRVAFFKTIFGKGGGEGGFSVQVRGGLPVGYYRVCTMVAASNHQPVIMPVVLRGAQDDCQRFRVGY